MLWFQAIAHGCELRDDMSNHSHVVFMEDSAVKPDGHPVEHALDINCVSMKREDAVSH
jgi:hypothetical protein